MEQYRILLSENTLWSWLVIVAVAALATPIAKGLLKILSSRLRMIAQRTEAIWYGVGLDIVDGFKAVSIFVWIFFVLSNSLELTEIQGRLLLFAIVTTSIYQVAIWGLYLIGNWRKTVLEKRISEDPSSAAALGLLYTAIQTVFLSVILLIGLSNLGIDISALIAGLGVGGIAIALAAQNVLGDLLASLSIVLDKPFVVGDSIQVDTELGTVEHIGIKTTRLRSVSGEELVMSNKDLLESRIRNYKKMGRRRVVQNFGVLYSTPPTVLEQIPAWTKGFVEKHEKLLFDRCHFVKYGDSSLDFELVFFVLDPDYNTFMDLQQKVLFDVLNKFNSDNVGFAFPTQTIYVEKLATCSSSQF